MHPIQVRHIGKKKNYYFWSKFPALEKGQLLLVDTAQGQQFVEFIKFVSEVDHKPTKAVIAMVDNVEDYYSVNGEMVEIKDFTPHSINYDVPIEDHQNSNIVGHIHSAEKMIAAGLYFVDSLNRWVYNRTIISNNQGFDIGFMLSINKDGKVEVDVLDNAFCQPCDYQSILRNNVGNRFAREAHLNVQHHMKGLLKNEIISGYKENDYI